MVESSIFEGTAEAYVRYRVPYPGQFVSQLVESCREHCQMQGLVDIGAGTGELLEGLAPHFGRVMGVEPDSNMVDEAKKRLADIEVPIQFCRSRAEDLDIPSGEFDVATFGNSFHWLDQAAVLALLKGSLISPPVVVVVNSTSPFRSTSAWQREVVSIIERVVGQRRRAGPGGYFSDQPLTQEEALQRGGFIEAAEIIWKHEQRWAAESYIGFLRSTSFASDIVLGQQRNMVHEAVRELFAASPDGQLIDQMEFHARVAVSQ